MTESMRDILRAIDALSPAEKQQLEAEILHRWVPDEGMRDEALDELAAELFRGYDAEESEPVTATIPNGAPHEHGIRVG